MDTAFDTSDPLGALMAEWKQTAVWFWFALAAALILQFVKPEIAWIVGVAAIGMPIIHLGQTVVIVGNELRKRQRAERESSELDR